MNKKFGKTFLYVFCITYCLMIFFRLIFGNTLQSSNITEEFIIFGPLLFAAVDGQKDWFAFTSISVFFVTLFLSCLITSDTEVQQRAFIIMLGGFWLLCGLIIILSFAG